MQLKILFVVGKGGDNYQVPYTSKKAPKWLKKGVELYDEYYLDGDEVPSDIAMAMYLQYKYPKCQIDLIEGSEVHSKTQLDDYDTVFVINDGTEVFLCGSRKTCLEDLKKFEKAVSTTDAFVYPYPKFHKYIINKFKYYADLKRAGIPVVDFIKAVPKDIISNVKAFRAKVEKKGWKGIIIKPSYGGYAVGIKVMKNFSRTTDKTVKDWFRKLQSLDFPNVTVQEFIPSFGKNFEVRTYWINQKYAYSVATLSSSVKASGIVVDDVDTFVSEGGNLPNSLKNKLKILGKEVIKSIMQYKVPQPFLRIDFGCCLATDNCPETYFVNEVETLAANMLPDDQYPVVEKTANALHDFAVKMKGKSEPIGKKSTYKAKVKVCPKSVNKD